MNAGLAIAAGCVFGGFKSPAELPESQFMYGNVLSRKDIL
jgi:hypothetical protein